MMTSKFEGFEKSAPRGIPKTTTDNAVQVAEPEAGDEAEAILLPDTETTEAPKKKKRRRVSSKPDNKTAGKIPGKTSTAQFDAPAKKQATSATDDSAPAKVEPESPSRLKEATPPSNGANRVESAWDAPSYPSIENFAKAFVDHTESMLSRVLEKEAEIVKLQQKMIEKMSDNGDFNKKDAAFLGLIAFIMFAFGLMYFIKG